MRKSILSLSSCSTIFPSFSTHYIFNISTALVLSLISCLCNNPAAPPYPAGMGNAVLLCFHPRKNSDPVKLIFWEGSTKALSGSQSQKRIAGEIMFEFPDKMVCHANSFFLGHPIPCLSIDDELIPGQTYFVLPIDFFPHPPSSSLSYTLSASTLVALGSSSSSSSSPKRTPMDFGEDNPFQQVKGEDGRLLMKISPDFITRIITKGKERDDAKDGAGESSSASSLLCSTPELRKQYEQLVGCREQVWSPKLETILEHKIRYSPCRFIRLESWKKKEKGN